jgi:phytoene dehydrogenase-like protein
MRSSRGMSRGHAAGLDAVVVGSGPNGLAAAITLAEAGLSVEVVEGADTTGGGCRTEALTRPGYRHDVCSAVHPLVLSSPFFARPAFDDLRQRLVHPDIPFAHPLEDGRAAAAHRSVEETAATLGAGGPAYRKLMAPLVRQAGPITAEVLGPLRSFPSHPLALARFGLPGLLSIERLVGRWQGDAAPALLAGVAAHSMAPLDAPLTAAFGLLLATTAHSVGWPVVAGGSSAITEAMVAELERLGGRVTTGQWVADLGELPASTVVVLDTAPAGLLRLAGSRLPDRYRRSLRRFRYGPGVCKVDWALSGPVPWLSDACRRAGTVHLGGTLAEVAASEAEANAGRHAEHPYCIVVQPGVVDPSRAPEGDHTLWGYCHVPAGSTADMTSAIEGQIERFAPGFSDLVVARSVKTAADEERDNPNYVGGDIGGGAATFGQTLFRPTVQWNPYRTPLGHVYLCSASTPPGGGVHGMGGYYAARSVLHDHFGGPGPFSNGR